MWGKWTPYKTFYCFINQFVKFQRNRALAGSKEGESIKEEYVKLPNLNEKDEYVAITSHHINGSVPMKRIYQLLCDLQFSFSSCAQHTFSPTEM